MITSNDSHCNTNIVWAVFDLIGIDLFGLFGLFGINQMIQHTENNSKMENIYHHNFGSHICASDQIQVESKILHIFKLKKRTIKVLIH